MATPCGSLETFRPISVSHPLGVDTRPGRTPPGTGLGEALGERLGPSHHPTGRQQVCVPLSIMSTCVRDDEALVLIRGLLTVLLDPPRCVALLVPRAARS